MHLELRRVAPLRAANICALLYAAMMLAFALPMFAMFSAMPMPPFEEGEPNPFPFGLFRFLLIIYPLMGAVFGWFGGLIGAWVYNQVAKMLGGMLFEVDAS